MGQPSTPWSWREDDALPDAVVQMASSDPNGEGEIWLTPAATQAETQRDLDELLAWLDPPLAAGIRSTNVSRDLVILKVDAPGDVEQTADAVRRWHGEEW